MDGDVTPVTHRPGRLRIGVIGAGRVGAVLAAALQRAGHRVTKASGASPASQERIEVMLPDVEVVDPDQVSRDTDVVLVTVPDDALEGLVEGLAQLGAFTPGQIVIHTAGRYGVEVLKPATDSGAIAMAIHPAMTFSGTSVDLGRIEGAPFAITTSPGLLPIAQALVVEMGGEPVVLGDAARHVYHAAMAHGANHLVTLVSQARQLLEDAGVEDSATLFAPLLHAALEGALTRGDHALTGPIRRGDAGTVAAHVHALASHNPQMLPTYRELARATVSRAANKDLITTKAAMQILDALDDYPPHDEHAGTTVVHTVEELHALLGSSRRGVVMTMGALHEGHLELVRQAKREVEQVVVTIFVNPLQFGHDEDLDTYPRTLEADTEKLRQLGVDIIFAPSVEEIYPQQRVSVQAGEMGAVLEGAARPGHFDGMLTVVNKLLGITRPQVAYFGQKDAQQLALVKAMVADLNMGVDIRSVPIVRDSDGLALSSRNTYLTPTQRRQALVIPRTIEAGVKAAADGANPREVLALARREFHAEAHGIELDYLVLVDPDTMQPHDGDITKPGLLAIAAMVGTTRLIDNAVIEWLTPDRGGLGATVEE